MVASKKSDGSRSPRTRRNAAARAPEVAEVSAPRNENGGLQLGRLCAEIKGLFVPSDVESALVNAIFGFIFVVQIALFMFDVMYWGFFLLSFMIIADTALLVGGVGFALGLLTRNKHAIRDGVLMGLESIVFTLVLLLIIYIGRDSIELYFLGPENIRTWRFTGI